MKKTQYAIAIGMRAGLGACSDMMAGAFSHRAVTQPTVAPDMVRQVQSKLRDDGYYKQGTVDGVWGSGTETAVRSFQHDHTLNTSGQLDVPTLQALDLASTTTANPSPGNNPLPPSISTLPPSAAPAAGDVLPASAAH